MNGPGTALAREARAAVHAVRATAPGRVTLAVRASLCVGVPLAVGVAVGHAADGAAASFGGLAGLYVPQSPYRYRARVVASVGVGLAVCILLGGLVGRHGWLAVPVAGLVAAVASFACQAAEVPPPRELMLVMAVLAATDIPGGAREALHRSALAAAGAVFAWLVTMSPDLSPRRHAPERRALVSALAAVAGLLDAVGTAGLGPARQAALTGVRAARLSAIRAGLAHFDRLARAVVATEALLEAALHVALEASAPLDPAWGAAVRATIPAVSGGTDETTSLPADRSFEGAAPLAQMICDLRMVLTGAGLPSHERPGLPALPGLLSQLGAAARRNSVVAPSAVRIGVTVAIGVGIGRALGLGHAYWVGLTAAAVLQGSNFAVTRRRVVYRVSGTVVGVGLAYALLGWDPPVWVVVVAAAMLQAAVELVIASHYAIAVVGITVLALVLFHLAAPGEAVGGAIGARLIDTAVGALLALVLRAVLWPRSTSVRLPQIQARALRAVGTALAANWSATGGPVDPRRELQRELAVLNAVHADALGDTIRASNAGDTRWPVSVAIEELAFLALSRPSRRPPPPEDVARLFLRYLDDLGAAVVGGPAPTADAPPLPGFPLTAAAASTLAAAVAAAGR